MWEKGQRLTGWGGEESAKSNGELIKYILFATR